MSTSKPKPSDLDPFDSREQLVEHMRLGSKTEDERGLGVEHEKFGFRIVEGELRPLDYADGIVPLLEGFIEKFGWEPDTDDGAIIALHRGEDVISLEPGCQLELAGGVVQRIDEIEEQLALSPFILQCMIEGANKPYNVALIVVDTEALNKWAKEQNVSGDLLNNPRVQELIKGELDRVGEGLKGYEKPKKFKLLDEEWTTANGILTPKMSLKRRVVMERYGHFIEEMLKG